MSKLYFAAGVVFELRDVRINFDILKAVLMTLWNTCISNRLSKKGNGWEKK